MKEISMQAENVKWNDIKDYLNVNEDDREGSDADN
jgi:hypothetical protein